MNIVERKLEQIELKYQSRLYDYKGIFSIGLEYLYGDDDTATCLIGSKDFQENTVAVFDKHSSNIEFKTIPYQEIEKYRKIKQKWIDKAEEKGLY